VTYKPCHEPIATEIAHQALTAYKALGCRDAGRVDIRLDKHNQPVFIEINPLAGLNPIDSDLPILSRLHGIDYKTLIGRIISSASERIK
jgi:D-alanine-D-alanine ligase